MMPKFCTTRTATELAKQAQREKIATQLLSALITTMDVPSKPNRGLVQKAIGWADLLIEELNLN